MAWLAMLRKSYAVGTVERENPSINKGDDAPNAVVGIRLFS